MTWEQIRTQFPNQWVFMESLKSHMEGDMHIFEELSVIDAVADNKDLFPRYKELRRQYPSREIVFYHASNPCMEVKVQYWAGVRPSQ